MSRSVRTFETNKLLLDYINLKCIKPTAVADKANIRRDTFSRILACQRPIYADEIVPICEAMDISIDVLLKPKIRAS